MTWSGFYLRIFSIWVALAPWGGYAQVQGRAFSTAGVDAAGNSETVEAALHQMSGQAAVIFVGKVAQIHRSQGSGLASGAVEIRFEVEQAIRGCSGGVYTLREWAGLWSANDARYQVGQRLLLLLRAPGAAGLSSPVGGLDGAIPLRASGAGVRSSDASAALTEPVADLRWIGAKLARTVSYRAQRSSPMPMPHSASSAPAPTTKLLQGGATARSGEIPSANGGTDSSTPAQEAAVSTVVSMIRSWEVIDARR